CSRGMQRPCSKGIREWRRAEVSRGTPPGQPRPTFPFSMGDGVGRSVDEWPLPHHSTWRAASGRAGSVSDRRIRANPPVAHAPGSLEPTLIPVQPRLELALVERVHVAVVIVIEIFSITGLTADAPVRRVERGQVGRVNLPI